MITLKPLKLPNHIYPIDEWKIIEARYYPRALGQSETIFAVGNGYMGMRGNFDEGAPVFQPGTFINGVYESWPIQYGEEAYGFAKVGQTMLNVPDCKIIKLFVDDDPLYLPTEELSPTISPIKFVRVLDMKSGTLRREIVWETPSGKKLKIESRRLVSLKYRHLAAITYKLTLLNDDAPIVLSSEVKCYKNNFENNSDPRQAKGFKDRVFIPMMNKSENMRIMLSHRTKNSGIGITSAVDHIISTDCDYSYKSSSSEFTGQILFSFDGKKDQSIEVVKFITYHTSRTAQEPELTSRASRTLDRAVKNGVDELFSSQQKFMDEFWRRSDIQIDGDPIVQQNIRWALFQMLQATARADRAGIPVKGLTGLGYEGHYFWDAEIYVLPFLIYTFPRIARNQLKFRYSILGKAIKRAKEVNQKGALFPWRTINGEEASAYYAAGTAQYHINADIMYALKKYVNATGDKQFLNEFGAEMLVETARLWCDLGFYSQKDDNKFCIHGVTGPDEYTAIVNNNTFTNLMARENLLYAVKTVENLMQNQPISYAALEHETKLDVSEINEWKKSAENMKIPFDKKLKIHPQDDNFLYRKVWDFKNTPKENYPLLLHYHPLVIYRHQVIKQADIVLAMFFDSR